MTIGKLSSLLVMRNYVYGNKSWRPNLYRTTAVYSVHCYWQLTIAGLQFILSFVHNRIVYMWMFHFYIHVPKTYIGKRSIMGKRSVWSIHMTGQTVIHTHRQSGLYSKSFHISRDNQTLTIWKRHASRLVTHLSASLQLIASIVL